MHSAWLRSTFLRVLKFLYIKEGDLISGGNQFCRMSQLFGSPFCILILKALSTISSPFVRFQCILHDSGVLFSEYWNFYKLKRGDLISAGNQFYRMSNYLVPLLYFNFKSFLDPNSLSFIVFQCILHYSGVLFSESSNFYKLKRGI